MRKILGAGVQAGDGRDAHLGQQMFDPGEQPTAFTTRFVTTNWTSNASTYTDGKSRCRLSGMSNWTLRSSSDARRSGEVAGLCELLRSPRKNWMR
jgi:hypothetical protein